MPSLQASVVCVTKADGRDWIYSTGWTKIEDILYGSMSIAMWLQQLIKHGAPSQFDLQ